MTTIYSLYSNVPAQTYGKERPEAQSIRSDPVIAQAIPYYPILLGPLVTAAPERAYEISKADAKIFTKNKYRAEVVNIVDGDTIDVHIPEIGKDYYVRVRYIGMDTPETHHPRKGVQCYGLEATEQNAKLVKGKTVTLVLDIEKADRYERLLAYVYVGKGKKRVFVNDWLVRNGYAHVATFPPNVKYQKLFLEAERYAREQKLGFWADGVCK